MKSLFATALTHTSSTALDEPGAVRWEGAKAYKYVLAEDANILVGDSVEFSDTTGYEVTKDRAGGSSIGRAVAGVAVTAIADAKYGWIQVYGVNHYTRTDGNAAAGSALIPHATSDGLAGVAESGSTAVNTEAQVFAYALNADTTTTIKNCTAFIRCL